MPLIVVPATGVQKCPPIWNHQLAGPFDSVRSTDTLSLTVAAKPGTTNVALATSPPHPLSAYALALCAPGATLMPLAELPLAAVQPPSPIWYHQLAGPSDSARSTTPSPTTVAVRLVS